MSFKRGKKKYLPFSFHEEMHVLFLCKLEIVLGPTHPSLGNRYVTAYISMLRDNWRLYFMMQHCLTLTQICLLLKYSALLQVFEIQTDNF